MNWHILFCLCFSFVSSVPFFKEGLEDHIVESDTNTFWYVVGEDLLGSTDDSTIYVSVNIDDQWILRTVSSTKTEGSYEYLHVKTLFANDEYLFIGDDCDKILIFDIRDLTSPLYINKFRLETSAGLLGIEEIIVHGDKLIISHYHDEIIFYDISDMMNPLKVGQFLYDENTYGILVKEDILYVTYYSFGVVSVDISDITNPRIMNETYLYKAEDIVYDETNDILVVTAGTDGVWVLDPDNLSVRSSYEPPFVRKYACASFDEESQVLFLTDEIEIQLFSVIDPDAIDEPFAQITEVSDVICAHNTKENILVAWNDDSADETLRGIYFFDVSNVSSPTNLSFIPVPYLENYPMFFIRESDDIVFATLGEEKGMMIIDFSDPFHPQIIYELYGFEPSIDFGDNNENNINFGMVGEAQRITFSFSGFVLLGSTILSGEYMMSIIDVSGVTPLVLSNLEVPGQIYGLSVSEDETTAYVCYLDGLLIVDITNKGIPNITSSVDIYHEDDYGASGCYNLFHVDDEVMFLATYDSLCCGGVKVVDVSNSLIITTIDQDWTTGVFVSDSFLYIISWFGLDIHDISGGILNPEFLGMIDITDVQDFSINEDETIAYLLYNDFTSGYLKILNISDKSNPEVISTFTSPKSEDLSYRLVVKGDLVFLAYGTGGVLIVDVSDISSPVLLSTSSTDDYFDVIDLYVVDDHIYVADGKEGMKSLRMENAVYGNPSTFSYFCGTSEVTIDARDRSGEVSDHFEITRESYCYGRGECLPGRFCDCDEEYFGERCEIWRCDDIDFTNFQIVCSGHGTCVSPEVCECSYGYNGKLCSGDWLTPAVSVPLSLFGGGLIMLVPILLCCCVCCCVCYCICCFCISFLFLCGVISRQMIGLRKYGKLRNFDLLLQEQEMEDDTSIAHLKINENLFKIDIKEISLKKVLGEGGSNSVVYEAEWGGKIIAFKCFRTRTVCTNQEYFDEFEREVTVLSSVSHPNILQFFGCCLHPPRVGIVMEFCENGDLARYMIRKKNVEKVDLEFSERIRFCFEIAVPMGYLHSRNVVHRDLKCENVLLDSTKGCKLMDFGLSKIVDQMSEHQTKRIGTNCFMAPEIVTGDTYDEKIDVFSFGICCFIIFTDLFKPYGNFGTKKPIEMMVANDPLFRPDITELDRRLRVTSEKVLEDITKLIKRCWSHSPHERYSFEEIIPLIKEIDRVHHNNGEKSKDKEEDMFISWEVTSNNSINHKGTTLETPKNNITQHSGVDLSELEKLKIGYKRIEEENGQLKKEINELKNRKQHQNTEEKERSENGLVGNEDEDLKKLREKMDDLGNLKKEFEMKRLNKENEVLRIENERMRKKIVKLEN